MERRRSLLVAVLVYVTLDLSLAAMPGAFVFEPADSVESTHSGRGRGTTEVVVRAAPAKEPCVLPPSRIDVTERAAAMIALLPRGRFVASCLPRASLAPACPSEDPH